MPMKNSGQLILNPQASSELIRKKIYSGKAEPKHGRRERHENKHYIIMRRSWFKILLYIYIV